VEYKDYYKTLGVSRTATDKEIKAAYRKLAKVNHPDVNKGDPAAAERFKGITEAYAVLSDPEKRRRYDALGPDWQNAAGGFGGFAGAQGARGHAGGFQGASGFSDFFETLFGGGFTVGGDIFGMGAGAGGRTGRAPSMAGVPAVEYDVALALSEVVNGTRRRLIVDAPPCPTCGGGGEVMETSGRGGRRRTVNRVTCPTCHGRGVAGESRTVEVKIPPGVEDGSRLWIRPAGEAGKKAGEGAEIALRIRYLPHPVFRVEGRDFVLKVPLLDHEAALGTALTVPVINGSVRMTVPPGTRADQVLRIRGQGLPSRDGGPRGDLLVQVSLIQPSTLSAKEREAYELLRAARASVDPRAQLFEAARGAQGTG
jgi:DnaJ-class molecular chaperone